MQLYCTHVLCYTLHVSELFSQIDCCQNKLIKLLRISLRLLLCCLHSRFVKIYYTSIHAALVPHNFASLIEMRFKWRLPNYHWQHRCWRCSPHVCLCLWLQPFGREVPPVIIISGTLFPHIFLTSFRWRQGNAQMTFASEFLQSTVEARTLHMRIETMALGWINYVEKAIQVDWTRRWAAHEEVWTTTIQCVLKADWVR